MASDDRRSRDIQPGDTVAFSRAFLQATGQYTGDAPLGRGKVKTIERLSETQLAVIDWFSDDLPAKVNISNLVLVEKGIVMDLP